MKVYTLRPGLLVSLRTEVRGNVKNDRNVIDAHVDSEGAQIVRAETLRVVQKPEEHAEATKVRGKARNVVARICSPSNYGLLCRFDQKDKLDAAITEARALADEFNSRSELSRVTVNVLVGQVSSSDAEAIRAINGEIRDMLDQMTEGLKNSDATQVREAALAAKKLGAMLTDEAGEKVRQAIEVARAGANRIGKSAEVAAGEIDTATLEVIKRSRTAFLDMSDATEIAAPTHAPRVADLAPDDTDLMPPMPTVASVDMSEPATIN